MFVRSSTIAEARVDSPSTSRAPYAFTAPWRSEEPETSIAALMSTAPATVMPACKFIAPWKSEVLFASIAPATVMPACKFIAPWKSDVLFASIAPVNVDTPVTPSVPATAVLPDAAATVNMSVLTEKAPTTFAACLIASDDAPDASMWAARSTICTFAYSPVISSL